MEGSYNYGQSNIPWLIVSFVLRFGNWLVEAGYSFIARQPICIFIERPFSLFLHPMSMNWIVCSFRDWPWIDFWLRLVWETLRESYGRNISLDRRNRCYFIDCSRLRWLAKIKMGWSIRAVIVFHLDLCHSYITLTFFRTFNYRSIILAFLSTQSQLVRSKKNRISTLKST